MKRLFSVVASAMLMGVVCLVSNCKSQGGQGQVAPTKLTITYSTEHGIAPSAKTVEVGYKLTLEDLAPIAATDFTFESWYIGSKVATVGYEVTKNTTLTAKWTRLNYISFTTSKIAGDDVSLFINAEEVDQIEVWLDLNNNETKDEGEKVENFDSLSSYTIESQTFKLYGNVTHLSCSGCMLTNLDVSGDAALTNLDCNENLLKTLDVHNNKALKVLSCNENQLTSLDVKGLKELILLSCFDNKLKSIDVSSNTALRDLSCGINELATLDVHNNTALEKLYCNENKIASLDANGLTALKNLSCDKNELTSLNINGLEGLIYVNCSDNKLSSLDVGKSVALTRLYCNANQLNTLNVSGLKRLTHLNCFRNELTSLSVKGLTALTYLNCCENKLGSLDVNGLVALKKFWCHKNKIKEANMDALISSLPPISSGSGELIIIDSVGTPEEENTYTTENVNDAKAKKWKVYDNKGSYAQKIEL